MTTHPSSTPITAEGAVTILRDAIKEQLDTAWECNSDHPALRAAIAATDPAAIQPAGGVADDLSALSQKLADHWHECLWLDASELMAVGRAIESLRAPQDAKAEQVHCIVCDQDITGSPAALEDCHKSSQSAPIEAGELPPLPEPSRIQMEFDGKLSLPCLAYMEDQMRAYGQLCRDTARPASSVTSGASKRERELDHALDQTIGQRDQYHEWADILAENIALYFGADIGEHSNQNCPWAEALEIIENAINTKPASTAPVQGKASDAEDRYEFVRKLHPVDFATLYSRNLAGEGPFDDLVDAARAQQQAATPQKFVPGMNDIGGEE